MHTLVLPLELLGWPVLLSGSGEKVKKSLFCICKFNSHAKPMTLYNKLTLSLAMEANLLAPTVKLLHPC